MKKIISLFCLFSSLAVLLPASATSPFLEELKNMASPLPTSVTFPSSEELKNPANPLPTSVTFPSSEELKNPASPLPDSTSSPTLEDLKNQAEVALMLRSNPYEISELKKIFALALQDEPMKMLETVYDLWSKKPELNQYTAPKQVAGLRCVWINAKLLLTTDDPAEHQKGLIYQYLAAPVLPYKANEGSYTYGEILEKFKPFLLDESKKRFEKGFSILLDQKNGKPKHTGTALVDAYRCLLGKCIYASTQDNPQKFQIESMDQLFAFPTHKKVLTRVDEPFGKSIGGFACSGCQAKAKMSALPSYPFDLGN